jgi:hypothetical protein
MHRSMRREMHTFRVLVVLAIMPIAAVAGTTDPRQEPTVVQSSQNGLATQKGLATFEASRVTGEYATPEGNRISLDALGAKPLSLTTGDINDDGYPDLAVAYASGGTGMVAIHLANPEAFSPQLPSSLAGISRGVFPKSFVEPAVVIQLPVRPDFLAIGHFGPNAGIDLLFAARGDNKFYIAPGIGRGAFGPARSVVVAGGITALATGVLQATRPGADVVIGLVTDSGSLVTVYKAGHEATGPSAAYPIREPVSSLAIGRLDDDRYPDVVIVAGNSLMILHGDALGLDGDQMRLETLPLAFGVKSAAPGRFVPGRVETQIAVLRDDGRVAILGRQGADRPEKLRSRQLRAAGEGTWGVAMWEPRNTRDWTALTAYSAMSQSPASARLIAGRFSGSPTDDLVVIDAAGTDLTQWDLSSQPDGGSSAQFPAAHRFRSGGPIVAAVAMRINVMGSLGMVTVAQDETTPVALSGVPGVTYHVTTLGDSQAGTCSAPTGSPLASNCTTLRAAVIAANANPGQDAIVFDVNGVITLSVPGQDDTGQAGDLDVTDALTIIGNGTSNTIIQGGPSAGSGIDKIFSFNPLGLQPGFAVSITGLTLQFGTNTVTDPSTGNNEGGAFDFDASALDGAGSLSVSSCNILQSSTLNGNGGGLALFDGGTVTITNSAISGNQAGMKGPDPFGGAFGFDGGGIFVNDPGVFAASVTITSSAISNNSAVTPGQIPPLQLGGGIFSLTPGVAVYGSTVSGNQSNSDGGGLWGYFYVDQGSLISGNISGGLGGGVFGVSSINRSALISNTATTGGGALYSNGPGATITNSRIVGNSSAHGAPALDSDTIAGGSVSASNNWWGSNASPANLVAPSLVTYSPWLVMTFAASPASINTSGTSILTARVATGNDGSTGYQVADGTPVSVAGTPGSVSPASSITASGAASSTYTAGTAAGTASVSATLDSQTLTASINVTLAPVPTLTTIAPASGVQGATVPVTLTGTNFVSGATVAVNNPGIAVGAVNVVSATQITVTFTIGANTALGAANITVTTSGGTSAAAVFTVNPPVPTLSTIAPAIGVQGATVPVTLTGTNFVSGTTVAVNNPGIAVSAVNVVSATQITVTFTIAANAALGTTNVTVTTSGGTSAAVVFTVDPPPVVASPAFAPPGGTYPTAQSVVLSSTTSGATIRYTTDGSTPTASTGSVYARPITVVSANTINAIAYMNGFSNSVVSSATYTVKIPSGMPFSPVLGDAYVSSASPTMNFSNLPALNVAAGSQALIQFNLSTLPPGLPASAVQRATVSLWVNSLTTAGSVAIAQVNAPWTEGAVTLSTAPATGAIQGVVPVTNSACWVTLDVTSLVQSWITAPSANYGIQISPSASDPNTVVYFDSKENTASSHPARLDIVLNGAAPLVTATVGDAMVNGASPSSNYGSTVSLNVNGTLSQSSFVAFDLSGLPAGTLASEVNQATLFLWENKVGNVVGTFDVSQVTSPWSETTVTFNTAPAKGPVQATSPAPPLDQWSAVDVTCMAKAWVQNPATNFGVELSPSPSSTISVFFDSKENTSTKNPARLQIVLQANAPGFSPPAGTYNSGQSVAISSATTGAAIRYTTDGSLPTATTGIVYSGPIAVSSTTTIKAIAYKSGMMDSLMASAVYTITQ